MAVAVLFSQCKQAGYVSRKYTKGKYHENKDKLTAKTNPGNSINLSHPGSVETKKPSVKLEPQKITLFETDKQKENAIALAQPRNTTAKHAPLLNPETKQALMRMRANLKDGIIKAFTFKKNKKSKEGAPEGLTTGLSIGAFASGVVSIILVLLAIITSLKFAIVSYYFFIAMGVGVLGLALGITTLVIGQGDLGSMQKSFSVLGIALGGGGLIFALLWYFLITLLIGGI